MSSDGFLLNLCSTLLKLSKPFIGDAKKFDLIHADTTFLGLATCHHGAFPENLTPLSPKARAHDGSRSPEQEFNFITQCFFLTWRCLHLSLAQQLSRHENLNRSLQHFARRSQDYFNDPHVTHLTQRKLLVEVLCARAMEFSDHVIRCTRWISMTRALLMMC